MSMKVQDNSMFIDAEFGSSTLLLQWVTGEIARFYENWRLIEITTAKHEKSELPYWVGLSFKARPAIEKDPLVA